jgi:RNA polymerase sigma-70 factor (ECF subfamily)
VEHQRRIYGFILMLVPNFSDAEDILQETVLLMWRKYDGFDPTSNFLAWGTEIARNKIMNYRKTRKSSKIIFSNTIFQRLNNRTGRMSGGMEDTIRALRGCLNKLSEHDRRLLKMRYEKGITIKSIAEECGRPVQGLYKVFARIINSLRKCVDWTISAWETV